MLPTSLLRGSQIIGPLLLLTASGQIKPVSAISSSSASEALAYWASVVLWVLVVLSIALVGAIALQVFRTAPTHETNAERQTRIQSVFDLLKFLLGTVAVGVLTMALDQGIKQREVILKERDESTKETEEFSKLLPNVLDSEPEKRTRFADFYATVTRDPEFRELWVRYSQIVKDDIAKKDDKTSQLIATLQKYQSATSPEEKARLQDQLSKQQLELASLKSLLGYQPGLPQGTTGWAYFGRWGNSPRGWQQVYFTLDMNNEAPDSGEASPREPVDIRDAPQRDALSKGVLQPGKIVKFENVQRMTDGQIWAHVTVQ